MAASMNDPNDADLFEGDTGVNKIDIETVPETTNESERPKYAQTYRRLISDAFRPEDRTDDDTNQAFFEVLSEYTNENGDPLDLLRNFQGVADRYIEAEQKKGTHTLPVISRKQIELRTLKTERATWALLHQLLSDRSEQADAMDDAEEESLNFYSDLQTYKDMWYSDAQFRELQIVAKALEKLYCSDYDREMGTVKHCGDNAAHEQQARAQAAGQRLSNQTYYKQTTRRAGISAQTSELDMDAKFRDHTNAPAQSDLDNEHDLMAEVWKLLRAGQLSVAQDVCHQQGHDWFAGLIEGCGGVGASAGEYDNRDAICALEQVARKEPSGNMDRVLWRGTCLELSRQPEEDAYARGICGIFGGDVGNFESAPVAAGINTGIPQWLQLCETFEDALCFLARIFCDNLLLQKVVVKEVTLGDALSRQRFAGRENYTPQTIRMGVNAEAANQWGVQDMYRTLSEWAHSDTNLRDALSDPYSTVQAATLQKDLPTLVETINRLLYSGIYSGAGMASDNNTSLNTSFSYPRRSMHAHRGLAPTPVARTCTRTPNRRAPPTPFLRGAQGLPVVHYLDRAQAQPTQQEGKGVDSVGSGSGRRGDRDEKASRVFPNPLAVLDSTDVVRTDTYNAHTDPPNHVATPTAADGDTHIHTHTHTMDDEIIGHEESAVPTSLAERSPTGTEVYANPNPNLNAVAASSEHALEYVTPSLLRFYAHLAIALSEVHKMKPSALKSVSETAVQSIVSRYVDLLIQQGQHPGLDRSNEIAPLYIERLGSVEQLTKQADLLEGAMEDRELLERRLINCGLVHLNTRLGLATLLLRILRDFRAQYGIPVINEDDENTLRRFSMSGESRHFIDNHQIKHLLNVLHCFNVRAQFMWESLELCNAVLRGLLLTGQYHAAYELAAAVDSNNKDNFDIDFGEAHPSDVKLKVEFELLNELLLARKTYEEWIRRPTNALGEKCVAGLIKMLESIWGAFNYRYDRSGDYIELETTVSTESDWKLLRRRFIPWMIKTLCQVHMGMGKYADAIKYTARYVGNVAYSYTDPHVCSTNDLKQLQRHIREACLKNLEAGNSALGV